jgi:hypothetical protein
LTKEVVNMYSNVGRWEHHEPCQVLVRSHRHQMAEYRTLCKNGLVQAFITPGWQLPTPYVYRLPGARANLTQFGGSLIRVGEEGPVTKHFALPINGKTVEVS